MPRRPRATEGPTTLEGLKLKHGRYEEVGGIVCRYCTHCHSLIPIQSFDYNPKASQYRCHCRACSSHLIDYNASPEGQAKLAKQKEISKWRQDEWANRQPTPPEKRRVHSRYEVIDGIPSKSCTLCQQVLPLDSFAKHGNNLRSQCKDCRRPKDKAWRDHKESLYPEKEKSRRQATYQKHRDKVIERSRLFKEANPERILASSRRRRKERMKNDIQFRLAAVLRTCVRQKLQEQNVTKRTHTADLVGCTTTHLRSHLESLFQPGMTWENYGAYRRGGPLKWNIDHIRPCVSFDLSDLEQQKICFHWTNLQPLWAPDNMAKGSRLDWKPKTHVPSL